ncbi:adenosine receptor A2a-like [Diadema antillarum]|uniref:adenosine receptor A2a-like n=1 Tax=Diadema antillarum TaxID=105358 RepID=UPI003A87B332
MNATDKLTSSVNNVSVTTLSTALFLTCMVPILICTIAGNGLVVCAVYKYHHLRTPTYLIIASLAVADFFTGFIGIPLYMYFNFSKNTRCDSSSTISFATPFTVLSAVSFFQILTITTDRYIAITRPLHYVSTVTIERVRIVIVFTWMACSAFFLTRSYLLVSKNANVITMKCPTGYFEDPLLWAVNLSVLAGSSLVFFMLTGFNLRILRIAFKQSRMIYQGNEDFGRNRGNHEISIKNLKGTQTICIIVFIFIVCFLPTQISFGIELSPLNDYSLSSVLAHVNIISLGINSAVNPLIYGYRDRLFREAFNDLRRSLIALIL